ncbi:hypothetical protein EJ04DRAFT_564889 [Polyplosphaeria fusca]|uniref:Uncharacterized protein n=1 Tax=Polyplosphaeria fusca TaxID=682080 RepID=A0A9P4QTR8_9PLEO|nr:hypothetical protein EJ04DRAFT_564889 [Polyplosphaeria fusca]
MPRRLARFWPRIDNAGDMLAPNEDTIPLDTSTSDSDSCPGNLTYYKYINTPHRGESARKLGMFQTATANTTPTKSRGNTGSHSAVQTPVKRSYGMFAGTENGGDRPVSPLFVQSTSDSGDEPPRRTRRLLFRRGLRSRVEESSEESEMERYEIVTALRGGS